MKRSLLAIALLLMTTAGFAQQDTIANAGFEQWNFNPQYDDPVGWVTLNQFGIAELAFKASNAGEFHSGSASIKLVTSNVLNNSTPSILTNGMINVVQQDVEGGTPFGSRPVSFGGWFRFDPVNADTAFFTVTLTKWNSGTGSSDVVGTSQASIATTSGSFVNLEIPFQYGSTEVPDTVLILIGSGTDAGPQEGSALYVDDLYYTYPQGIQDAGEFGVSVYPNPTLNTIRIGNDNGLRFKQANIFSVDGKLMLNGTIANRASIIDVSGLPTGVYFLQLESMEGQMMMQKFVKE